jgi:uridine phosphorylase
MQPKDYPILEFDPARKAIIEPVEQIPSTDAPEHCVITFFGEVLEKLHQEGKSSILYTHRWSDCERPVYVIEHQKQRIAAAHLGVGGPLVCGLLEEMIPRGTRKYIACGGCGVLVQDIDVGNIVVPTSAVRDEGTSYHYLPPGREVHPSPQALSAICEVFAENKIPFRTGKTWTTDAPYRETPEKVKLRRAEGCLTVEMEAASFFAVAEFRNLMFGQILYGGDDVSGEGEWDQRGWHSQFDLRERLFWLSVEACLKL